MESANCAEYNFINKKGIPNHDFSTTQTIYTVISIGCKVIPVNDQQFWTIGILYGCIAGITV